jgi:hypothetical protein
MRGFLNAKNYLKTCNSGRLVGPQTLRFFNDNFALKSAKSRRWLIRFNQYGFLIDGGLAGNESTTY